MSKGIIIQSLGNQTNGPSGGGTRALVLNATSATGGETLGEEANFDPSTSNDWWYTVHPDEGIVLWGPDIVDDKFDILGGTTLKMYSRASGGNNNLISPAAAAKVFGRLKNPNDPHQKLDKLIKDTHFAKKFKGLKHTEIANPFKKRMDYSTMQKFLGHAMKYYTAYKTLNYLEEQERASAAARQAYQENFEEYMNSGEAGRNQAWNDHYDLQFETTGSTSYVPCKPGCCCCWLPACQGDPVTVDNGLYGHILESPNWTTTNDPSSLTPLQNIASKKIWMSEAAVINDPTMGPYDPTSTFRMVAWGGGLDSYADFLNDPSNGFIGNQGDPDQWVSLNPANSHWNIGNFRDERLNPGQAPKNFGFATQKKLLNGFLIFGACLAGLGALARLVSKLTEDNNSSYSKNGFQTSTCTHSNTSRLLAHSVGQTALTSWVKNLMQEHDPTQFALDAYTGVDEGYKTLKATLIKMIGSTHSKVTGSKAEDNFSLLSIPKKAGQVTEKGAAYLVIDHDNHLDDVKSEFTESSPAFSVKALTDKLDKQFYSDAAKDATVEPVKPGSEYFKIIKSGAGYKTGHSKKVYMAKLHDDGGTEFVYMTDCMLFDESAYVTSKFYQMCYATLYENLKELRKSLNHFNIVVRTKKLGNLVKNSVVTQKGGLRMAWSQDISQPMKWGKFWKSDYIKLAELSKLYLVTYKDAAGNITTNASDAPHQVWSVQVADQFGCNGCGETPPRNIAAGGSQFLDVKRRGILVDGYAGSHQPFQKTNVGVMPDCTDTAAIKRITSGKGWVMRQDSVNPDLIQIYQFGFPYESKAGKTTRIYYAYKDLKFVYRGQYWVPRMNQRGTPIGGLACDPKNPRHQDYRLCAFYDTLIHRLDAMIFKAKMVLERQYEKYISEKHPEKSTDDMSWADGKLIPILEAELQLNNRALHSVNVKEGGWNIDENNFGGLKLGDNDVTAGGCNILQQTSTVVSAADIKSTLNKYVGITDKELKVDEKKDVKVYLWELENPWKGTPSSPPFKIALIPTFKETEFERQGVKVKRSYLHKVLVRRVVKIDGKEKYFHPDKWDGNRKDASGNKETAHTKGTREDSAERRGWFFIVEPSITVNTGGFKAGKQRVGAVVEPAPNNTDKNKEFQYEIKQFISKNALSWEQMFNSHQAELIKMAEITKRLHEKGVDGKYGTAAKTTRRGDIFKLISALPVGQSTEDAISAEEKKNLKSLTFYRVTFGKCDSQVINGLSTELSKRFFSNQTAYNVFAAPAKILEGLCGKSACGAVHAFTRVPPLGIAMDKDDEIKTGGPDEPLPLCGNITITFRFLPTLNTQVVLNLGNDSLLNAIGAGGTLAVNSNVLPNFKYAGGKLIGDPLKGADVDGVFGQWNWPWSQQKNHVPATGDVGLPEIWGNWSNASYNVANDGADGENWTGGWVQSVLIHDNIISNIFKAIVGLFTDAHLPNLGIWHMATPYKAKGNANWSVNDMQNHQKGLSYVKNLRKSYEEYRMVKWGWGPYAHELSDDEGALTGSHMGWGVGGSVVKTQAYSASNIAGYHLAHIGKALQGFYRDLNLENRVWSNEGHEKAWRNIYATKEHTQDSNIHPSRKVGIEAETVIYPIAGADKAGYPRITKNKEGNWAETAFEDSDSPLKITRTLSGMCYPVVAAGHGYVWERLILASSSEKIYGKRQGDNPFNDFEHWGQQREYEGKDQIKNHSAFLSNSNGEANSFVPSSWLDVMTKIKNKHPNSIPDLADLGEHWGWSKNPDGSSRTIRSIKSEICQDGNYNVTPKELSDCGFTSDDNLPSKFPIREHQEITHAIPDEPYEEKSWWNKAQGQQGEPHPEYGWTWAPKCYINNVVDFNHTKESCEAATYVDIHGETKNGIWRGDYLAGALIDGGLPDGDDPKNIKISSDETFPGNNEWAGLVSDLNAKLVGMADIFPRIYVNDYKFGTELYESGIKIGDDNTNLIDLKAFIKEYVNQNKNEIVTSQFTTPKWQKDGHWSAWQGAYEGTIKGKWGLEGTGSNLIAAKADLSGQAFVYAELVNKFHLLNWGEGIHSTEVLDDQPMEGWDENTEIIYTRGYGHTMAEAEAHALVALKHELRNNLPTSASNAAAYNNVYNTRAIPDNCNGGVVFDICDASSWQNSLGDPLDTFSLAWGRTASYDNVTAPNFNFVDNDQQDIKCQGGIPDGELDNATCALMPRKYHILGSPDQSSPAQFGGSVLDPWNNQPGGNNGLWARYYDGNVPAGKTCGDIYKVEDGCLEKKIESWGAGHFLYGYKCNDDYLAKEVTKVLAKENLGSIYQNATKGEEFTAVGGANEYGIEGHCQCVWGDAEYDPNATPPTWTTNDANKRVPELARHLSFSDYINDSAKPTQGYTTISNNPTLYQETPKTTTPTQQDYKVEVYGNTHAEAEGRARGLFAMYTGTDNPKYKEYIGVDGLLKVSSTNNVDCACTLQVDVTSEFENLSFIPFDQTHFSWLAGEISMGVGQQQKDDDNGNPTTFWNGWTSTAGGDDSSVPDGMGGTNCGAFANSADCVMDFENTNGYTGEYDSTDPDPLRAQWGEWGSTGIVNIPVAGTNGNASTDTTVQHLYECAQQHAFDAYLGTSCTDSAGFEVTIENVGLGADYASPPCTNTHSYEKHDGTAYANVAEMLQGGQGAGGADPLFYSTANPAVLVDPDTCGVGMNPSDNYTWDEEWHMPWSDLPYAESPGNCGCDISELCDNPDASWNLPPGYKCYGKIVSHSGQMNGNDVSLKLYEQVISGKSANPDGDIRAGIISQTYWGTLEHKNFYNDNKYKATMTLNNCETYAAELSGECPVLNDELYQCEISGTLKCGTILHKYKAPLEKNKYHGYAFVSGWTPWVTGQADWTNAGMTIYSKDKKILPRYHEQEYFVNYGDDALATDVSYDAITTSMNSPVVAGQNNPSRKNRQVLQPTIPESRKSQHNELSIGRAWAMGMGWYNQNWAKVKFNPRDWVEGDDRCEQWHGKCLDSNNAEMVQQGGGTTTTWTQEECEAPPNNGKWKKTNCKKFKSNIPNNNVITKKANDSRGGLVFMGGWPLVNPAWDATAPTSKIDEIADKVLGTHIVILDTSYSDGAGKKRFGNNPVAASNAMKAGYTVKHKSSSSNVKKSEWKGNAISAVFYTTDAFETYIDNISIIRNVEILDYGSIAGDTQKVSFDRRRLRRKTPGTQGARYLSVAYAIIKGAKAACEHCLPTELTDPAGQAQERSMFFGEQFYLASKVKWDIYKGKYKFKVPLTLGGADTNNPLTGKPVKLMNWEEQVTPRLAEFDPQLSRTHYTLNTNSFNNRWPPGLACGNYSKQGKIVDFTAWTTRAWTEIPLGGMMEIGNGKAAKPAYVGVPGHGVSTGNLNSLGLDVYKLYGYLDEVTDLSTTQTLAIGKGPLSLNITNGMTGDAGWTKGMWVMLVHADNSASPAEYHWMKGEITAIDLSASPATMTVDVDSTSGGSGAKANWDIILIPHPYNKVYDDPKAGYQTIDGLDVKTFEHKAKHQEPGAKLLDLTKGAGSANTADTWGGP